MTIEQLAVVVPAAVAVESTTFAVKLNVPKVVGVPVIAPVVGFKVNPGGSDPLVIENVYGGAPPVATSAELYATPTCPVPAGQASVIGGGAMTMLQFVVAVPAAVPVESTTFAVKLNVPKVVGVPVIAPVVGFSVNPGGSEPLVIENA